jgi:hypothetical protein
MNALVKHAILPAIAPALIVGLYFTPVEWIGCANRGLAALGVVFIAFAIGIVMAVRALRLRGLDDTASRWFLISACILALPVLLVFGPLG